MKYKTSSHLVGAKGEMIATGSVVEASHLGDADTIKRYEETGAIAKATKEDEADAAEVVGGSIVESTPAEVVEVADEAESKAPSSKKPR